MLSSRNPFYPRYYLPSSVDNQRSRVDQILVEQTTSSKSTWFLNVDFGPAYAQRATLAAINLSPVHAVTTVFHCSTCFTRQTADLYAEQCLKIIAQASTTQVTDTTGNEDRSIPSSEIPNSLGQWKAALERAECLCTEMLRRGLPSCCVTQTTDAEPKKHPSAASVECTRKLAPDFVTRHRCACSNNAPRPNDCCSSSTTANTGCSFAPDLKTCCFYSPDAESTRCDTSAPPTRTCCRSTRSTKIDEVHTARHIGCSEASQVFGGQQSLVPATIDLEKGSGVEHVMTQISGMTCTGCERKLQRVLFGIAGVHNIQTSLVLGRAEFDVDPGLSTGEVVSLLERRTAFKCTVYQEGHQLTVLIPRLPSAQEPRLGATASSEKDLVLLHQGLTGSSYPFGVQDIQIIDIKGRERKLGVAHYGTQHRFGFKILVTKRQKFSARITYNPRIVGARDLLEKGFGVPLSLAPLSSDHVTTTENDHLYETFFMTLLSACLTIPVLVMSWAPLTPHTVVYGSSSLALATLVQCIVAGPFYPKALKALLFSRMIEMDLLIVISTTTAYIYSVVAFVYEIRGEPLSTGEFFETSTLLVTLIMCGRLASAYARRKAANTISVQALQPSTAILSEGATDRLIDIREFQFGDLFKVLPDSIVPTDGIIVSGETEIDESMITGEAVPVAKSSGSQIVAGSINGPGPILARLIKLPIDNTISRIVNMVDEAKMSKPRVQETADRVASYFVPCILALTVIVFSVWLAIGIAVRDTSSSNAVATAITYALAALIVSCPCAIGLAVPMVIVIAGGVGAKHGVILKSPDVIENARRTSHVVFDKTGTLTQGKFVVVEEVYPEGNREKATTIARQLTSSSKHPVSQALTTYLGSLENNPLRLESVSSAVGKGLRASLEGQLIKGGNPSYVAADQDPDVQRLLSQGLTVFCLRHGSALLAIWGLRDALRADTISVVSALQAQNILVSVVSGDSTTVVERLATELRIPLSRVKGECTPEDKAHYMKSLSTIPPAGRNNDSITTTTTTTIFCGDGTNDAVALAQADIGIHIAGGTDVAKSAADVVLTHPSLAGILALIHLSRVSMRRVYLNFAWSVAYNLIAVLLAAGAFVTARIPPAYAGLGELVSVLPVIAVAMQLRWVNLQPRS